MISYLATVTLAVGLLAGAPQAPRWEASYGKALQATREADAPLLVVLDKPNTEDARLEPELLSENVVVGQEIELLRPYRLCHVDVTTKYGRRVAKAFRANRFPHVAIIDKTGSTVIFHQSGQIQPKEWEQILTQHKSGDRIVAKAVSRTTYIPIETYVPGETSSVRPYCPNCQRNSY